MGSEPTSAPLPPPSAARVAQVIDRLTLLGGVDDLPTESRIALIDTVIRELRQVVGAPAEPAEPVEASAPERHWRRIVDAIPQLVWVADRTGLMRFYNGRLDQYGELDPGAAGSGSWAPLVHPVDLDEVMAAWRCAQLQGEAFEVTHRVQMRDGSYRWHLSRAEPTRDVDGQLAWFGTTTDIHERAVAEERIGKIIDGLFNFVGLCAPDGTLLHANRTALDAAGVDAEEVIGRPFWETYWWSHRPETQAQLRDAIQRAARGEASRYDVEVRVAGDRLITIDFQLVPVVEDGAVTGLVPSGSDITDRIAEQNRLEALATFSHRLNGASTTDEVSALVVEQADAIVDASFVNIALVDDTGTVLHLAQSFDDQDLADRWAIVPFDGPRTPFHDAIELGDAVFTDQVARAERYAHMVVDNDQVGLHTTAALPLRDETGATFGAIGFGWPDPIERSATLEARLRLLADLCGQAFSQVRRTETHDQLVRELQRRLLERQQEPPGLDLAVGYEPAESDIGFGGDWHEVVVMGDGTSAFIVGDVAGHGVAAAAEMATTKATVRAMLLASPERADALHAVTDALEHLQTGYLATVAVAWIRAEDDSLEWQLAGHVPPVLRTPSGGTRLLEGAHLPPLGMPSLRRGLSAEAFPSGSILVLYTDGLVERPDRDLDEGLEDLRALVEQAPAGCSAEELRDLLMAKLLGDGRLDDVAIVVVKRP